eukprot:scaffold477_cov73-Isochrysis_galbana.AAC.1
MSPESARERLARSLERRVQVVPTTAPAVSSANLRRAQALRERLRREVQAPWPGPTGRPAERSRYSVRVSPASVRRDTSSDTPGLTPAPRRWSSARAWAATASGDTSPLARQPAGEGVLNLSTPATRTAASSLLRHSAVELGDALPALAQPTSLPPSPSFSPPQAVRHAAAAGDEALAAVLTVAVGLRLTTACLADKMRRNVQEGRFSREHYVRMWGERIAQAEAEAARAEVEAGAAAGAAGKAGGCAARA